HAFSQGGARVALVARTEADLKAVADELPGPSLALPGDVTDEEFNETVADTTVAEWGGVDVWICNAGISPVVAGPRKTDPSLWGGSTRRWSNRGRTTRSSEPACSRTLRNGAGEHQPTWSARTSSWPPTPRRSSPAPCSPWTAGTCSYERASCRRDHRSGRNAR